MFQFCLNLFESFYFDYVTLQPSVKDLKIHRNQGNKKNVFV